jgi:hypothetical protein
VRRASVGELNVAGAFVFVVHTAESKNTRSWHNIAFYGIVSVYMLVYYYDKAKIIRLKKG